MARTAPMSVFFPYFVSLGIFRDIFKGAFSLSEFSC